jgi:hypothetical protein
LPLNDNCDLRDLNAQPDALPSKFYAISVISIPALAQCWTETADCTFDAFSDRPILVISLVIMSNFNNYGAGGIRRPMCRPYSRSDLRLQRNREAPIVSPLPVPGTESYSTRTDHKARTVQPAFPAFRQKERSYRHWLPRKSKQFQIEKAVPRKMSARERNNSGLRNKQASVLTSQLRTESRAAIPLRS